MGQLKERIAGEIAMSDSPGSAMKKWRELFGVSQIELAKQLKIAASTISDYESNRRLSPGVGVIKRFIETIFKIDEERGGSLIRGLENTSNAEKTVEKPPYNIKDFTTPIDGLDFSRIIDGKIVVNLNYLENTRVFGYTMLDSIRVILEMSPQEYPKLFGNTTERAFIFDNVSTGRSPMVVVRVAPIKPKVVVIQGVNNIDKLAVKLAQVERIPLITTKLSMEEIAARLTKV